MKNDRLVSMIDGIGQRYSQRPSEILGIKDGINAFDFDVAVALRATKIESGEITDKKNIKKRQTKGFSSAKALQNKVMQSKRRGIK